MGNTGITYNGITYNGITYNGITYNGITCHYFPFWKFVRLNCLWVFLYFSYQAQVTSRPGLLGNNKLYSDGNGGRD